MPFLSNDCSCSQVVAPLREIEFLDLEDIPSEEERSYLYNCVKSDHGNDPLPGSSHRPWQTPKREPDIELDFGSATAVFNSLQSGGSLEGGPGQQFASPASTSQLCPHPGATAIGRLQA